MKITLGVILAVAGGLLGVAMLVVDGIAHPFVGLGLLSLAIARLVP